VERGRAAAEVEVRLVISLLGGRLWGGKGKGNAAQQRGAQDVRMLREEQLSARQDSPARALPYGLALALAIVPEER
jgi:hypothetical protein